MAERTRIFDTMDELHDYLAAFLFTFLESIDAIPEEDASDEVWEKYEKNVGQVMLNIKGFAQEYAELQKDATQPAYLRDMNTYKKEFNVDDLEGVRKIMLEVNRRALKHFGLLPRGSEGDSNDGE